MLLVHILLQHLLQGFIVLFLYVLVSVNLHLGTISGDKFHGKHIISSLGLLVQKWICLCPLCSDHLVEGSQRSMMTFSILPFLVLLLPRLHSLQLWILCLMFSVAKSYTPDLVHQTLGLYGCWQVFNQLSRSAHALILSYFK